MLGENTVKTCPAEHTEEPCRAKHIIDILENYAQIAMEAMDNTMKESLNDTAGGIEYGLVDAIMVDEIRTKRVQDK